MSRARAAFISAAACSGCSATHMPPTRMSCSRPISRVHCLASTRSAWPDRRRSSNSRQRQSRLFNVWEERRMSLSSIAKLAGAAALVGLSAFAAKAQTSGEPIKIGAIVSATGAGAGLGVPERNGLLLAEKDINAKGGINGRPIKIIVEDDASNPDPALSKAKDLIFSQKVAALLGPSLTASTVAVGGVTHANKIPQIAFTGIGPAVERERKCLAHVLPPQ